MNSKHVLHSVFVFQCGFSLSRLTLLAWQHFPYFLSLSLNFLPLKLWGPGRSHPRLPAYTERLPLGTGLRSDLTLDLCNISWDIQKSRDLCLEATLTHLLPRFPLTLCVCLCVRGMLPNQVRRLIPLHEVWKTLTAARRIYQPLQVRHTHTMGKHAHHTLHDCTSLFNWGMQKIELHALWFFKVPQLGKTCTICVCTFNCCHFFPQSVLEPYRLHTALFLLKICRSFCASRKSGLKHVKFTLFKHSPSCFYCLSFPVGLWPHAAGTCLAVSLCSIKTVQQLHP